jgi:hypothetical protein
MIGLVLASAASQAVADVTLQLLVKHLASPNAYRPFGDIGRFAIRDGEAGTSAGECPGNTNAAGKLTCRFACQPGDPTTRAFKVIPPRNERTRLYTTPPAKTVSLQGCQLSVAELEFVYVDFALALRDLTKGTPLAEQFANAASANWDGGFNPSSEAWTAMSRTPDGRQKLDRIRSITGELALDKISAQDAPAAAKWDALSVGISNVLIKESVVRNYGKDAAAAIAVTPKKADFYRNLRLVGEQIEARPSMTPGDARRLNDVNKLIGTTSDKLPAASFKSIAID